MRISVAVVLALLQTSPLWGQEEKAKAGGDKFPTEGHRQLDRLAGDWDVAISFKIGPDKMSEGKAACESKWILGGMVLQQQYTSRFNGRPFAVMQLLGYDANKKKYFEIKLDNLDTGAMHNEGSLSEDGKTLTQVGERTDPETGKSARIRTVTTFVDDDHYTLEWYLPGEDGKEEKTVSLRHSRRR